MNEFMSENVLNTNYTVDIDIPVRVSMLSVNSAPFTFTANIDDAGQIILTPVSKDMSFEDANTDSTIEYDTPVVQQVTHETREGETTYKETSILIHATMLTEVDKHIISATVDDIGQCVIYNTDPNSIFLTASISDSLNLITEDFSVETYNGYTLRNTGEGWDILTSDGDILDTGVATLPEAKIVICTAEIEKYRPLVESTTSEDSTSESEAEHSAEDVDDVTPEVTAEVIEESAHLDVEDTRQDLITRFMRGELALFSDDGIPLETYLHLFELDSDRYSYYYDEESDAVISYLKK